MTSDKSIDLRQAEADPAAVFESPQDVLRQESLSRTQKLRILEQWKLDALDMDVAAEENMAGGEPSRLDDVIEALKALDTDTETEGTGATKHGF